MFTEMLAGAAFQRFVNWLLLVSGMQSCKRIISCVQWLMKSGWLIYEKHIV